MEMVLSNRQMFLIRSCIDAELEMSNQGDTNLSLSTDDAENPDEAQEALRQELIEIQNLMRPRSHNPSSLGQNVRGE